MCERVQIYHNPYLYIDPILDFCWGPTLHPVPPAPKIKEPPLPPRCPNAQEEGLDVPALSEGLRGGESSADHPGGSVG